MARGHEGALQRTQKLTTHAEPDDGFDCSAALDFSAAVHATPTQTVCPGPCSTRKTKAKAKDYDSNSGPNRFKHKQPPKEMLPKPRVATAPGKPMNLRPPVAAFRLACPRNRWTQKSSRNSQPFNYILSLNLFYIRGKLQLARSPSHELKMTEVACNAQTS